MNTSAAYHIVEPDAGAQSNYRVTRDSVKCTAAYRMQLAMVAVINCAPVVLALALCSWFATYSVAKADTCQPDQTRTDCGTLWRLCTTLHAAHDRGINHIDSGAFMESSKVSYMNVLLWCAG